MGLFSSIFGSGSKAAYDTTGISQATGQSNELYKQLYDEYKSNIDPYAQVGQAGLGSLSDYLGISGNTGAEGYGSFSNPYNLEEFYNDPGYQFRLQEGNKAIERGASAGGSLYSPATTKALMSYNQGLASEEYQDAFNRNQAYTSRLYDQLAGVSGMGQQAVEGLAGQGNVYAAAKSGNDLALQQAVLGSYQAKNAATGSAWNTLIGAGTKLGSAYLASDIRVKENIVSKGRRKGCKVYEFSYKGDSRRFEGVMAQEVMKTHPSAVKDIDGVLHVDYGQLGFNMREIA